MKNHLIQVKNLINISVVIMNSNPKTENIEKQNKLEDQTKQEKTFIQDVFKIDYANTSKIFLTQSQNSFDIKINNYLCYQDGQNLYKITQIIYEDKLIRIEDKFEVNVDPAQSGSWGASVQTKIEKDQKKCSRSIQKVRMFNKSVRKQPNAQKKDKKNIVKNVIKIFVSWLQKKSEQDADCDQGVCLNQIRKLLKTENYNNRLIKKIVQNGQISKLFLRFVQDSAEDEIKYSRVQDKESHYQALQIYKNLLLKSQNKSLNSYQSNANLISEVQSYSQYCSHQKNPQHSYSNNNSNEYKLRSQLKPTIITKQHTNKQSNNFDHKKRQIILIKQNGQDKDIKQEQ